MSGRFKNISKKVEVDSIDTEPKRQSEWLPRCQAISCKLKPSSMISGYQLCTYHFMQEQGEDFVNWQAISDAISNNEHLIRKMFSLYNKGSDFWRKPEHVLPLRGWDFCPFLEHEEINQYISKLETKVRRIINDEAAELILHGNVKGTRIQKKDKKPKGMKSIIEIAEALESHREANKEKF